MNCKPPRCIICSEGAMFMKTYEITYENQNVGSAVVVAEGLYLRIECQCTMPKRDLYRIFAKDDNVMIDLGICVPVGQHYSLVKRIPQKQFPGKTVKFYVNKNEMQHDLTRLTVDESQPFAYIDRLDSARVEIFDNKLCMVMAEIEDRA